LLEKIRTDGVRAMSARIEIKLDPNLKQRLEEIARVHGTTLSDLVRNGISVVLIDGYARQYETIEQAERALVRAIIEKPEFQEMLAELTKYIETIDECEGWDCIERTTLDVVAPMGSNTRRSSTGKASCIQRYGETADTTTPMGRNTTISGARTRYKH